MKDRGALGVLAILVVGFVAPAAAWTVSGRGVTAAGGAIELRVLLGSALLALLVPLVQIVMHGVRFGGPAIRSNRDDFPALRGAPARVVRAHQNLVESLLPFAATVLAAHALHVSTRVTVAAAATFLAARVVHLASYLLGIVVVRSAAFYAGLFATATIALAALAVS